MTDTSNDSFFNDLDAFLEGERPSRQDLLRRAWSETTGDPGLDALRRRSLAAQARQEPELQTTLRELELQGRSQLDLHLEGDRESRHEASARLLGHFLVRVSDAVKEVAKSLAGLHRLDGDVSVLAPSAGSVRVVFVEEDEPRAVGIGQTKADLWALGMERLASTLQMADEDLDTLNASIQDLRPGARTALRLLAQTVEEASWSLNGTMTDRRGHERALHLGRSGASRLVDATKLVPTNTYEIVADGLVDGWRWSSSTMRFARSKGAAIEAFVPEEWAGWVAEQNARPGRRLEGRFQVTETALSPKNVKRSFQLISIRELADLFDASR